MRLMPLVSVLGFELEWGIPPVPKSKPAMLRLLYIQCYRSTIICANPVGSRSLCYNNKNSLVRSKILEAIDLARKIVDIASDKQAVDIVLLDTRDICSFADYFVICTGESSRQLKAIIDAISEQLKLENIRPMHEEGTSDSGWVLLDYGAVIVHIFDSFQRDYYQLEKFWKNAPTKVRVP
jgi:ribosome-associated protein